MTVEGHAKVEAFPTKAFFVRMITRDISLEDCILDLIDNSVDGAWSQEGSRPMGLAEGANLSAYKIYPCMHSARYPTNTKILIPIQIRTRVTLSLAASIVGSSK